MIPSVKVLVDSSVWIDFFRQKKSNELGRLLEEDLVCINDIILTELIPSLTRSNQKEIIEGLFSLDRIPLSIDWELLRRYQFKNLSNGINKVGIPDLIIMQQVIQFKISLYTNDNHFYLMQNYFKFDLLFPKHSGAR